MTDWVDFKEIRERVTLEQVLFEYYTFEGLTRAGTKVVGPCPIHGGDSPRAFHADLDKNVWHCFTRCKKGGNQIDFVAAKEGVTVREAALRLKERFLAPSGKSPATPRGHPGATTSGATKSQEEPQNRPAPAPKEGAKPEKEPERNPPLEVELNLKPDHPHLVGERGLALATIREFGVGYCARGILKGCIAIPVHDEDGMRVAYAGRRLRPPEIREYGKYKFPKGFRKELVLYNLHRAKAHAATHGLILVEGFFNVLKLHEAGFPNVVAVMGSDLSEAQAALLDGVCSVTLLFDGDPAGRAGATRARERLQGKVPVRFVNLPDGYDPEDLPLRALRWLLNGVEALDLSEVSFQFRPSGGPKL